MSLKSQIEADIKQAMLSKDKEKLTALRGIKSLILLAESEKGGSEGLNEEKELALLMKAAKQRKESAEIYAQQGRTDLQQAELKELTVIEDYLPKQLSEEEIREKVKEIIEKTGASSMADMGKVMGQTTKELSGKADGKTISSIVKDLLK